jgi:hypothetical protein
MARAFAAAAAPVLAALVAAIPATGAQAPKRTASLTLASLAPLTVTGRSFGPRETVLLTYHALDGSSRLISVRATRRGGFRGAFRLRVGRCDSFTVRAVGTAGSRAILQVERSCDDKGKGRPRKTRRPGG